MFLGATGDPTKVHSGWEHKETVGSPHGLPDPRAIAPLVWDSVGWQQGWLLLQLRGPKDTPRLQKPTLSLAPSWHSGCRVSISCC